MPANERNQWTKRSRDRYDHLLWATAALGIVTMGTFIVTPGVWLFPVSLSILLMQCLVLTHLVESQRWRCDSCGQNILLERMRLSGRRRSHRSLRMWICAKCAKCMCEACKIVHKRVGCDHE